jgi:hypothetical protein
MERTGNNNRPQDEIKVPIDHEQIDSEVVAEGESRVVRKILRKIQELSTNGTAPDELLMQVLTPEEVEERYQEILKSGDPAILGLGEEFVRSYAIRRAFVARNKDKILGGVYTTGHYYPHDTSTEDTL